MSFLDDIVEDILGGTEVITDICAVGDDADEDLAQRLAQALKVNRTVVSLRFDSNQLGNQGLVHLSSALQFNATILSMHFHNNGIGGDGIAALAEGLTMNYNLATLSLRDNQINGADAASLLVSARSLTSLDLTGNCICDEVCAQPAFALAGDSRECFLGNDCPCRGRHWQRDFDDTLAVRQ